MPRSASDRRDQHEMAAALAAENLQRRLALRQGTDEVGHSGVVIGLSGTGAQRRPVTNAGIDDDPFEGIEHLGEAVKDGPDGLGIGDIECGCLHALAGGGADVVGQCVQAVGASGAQAQVIAQGGELVGHLFAQARTGTRDHHDAAVWPPHRCPGRIPARVRGAVQPRHAHRFTPRMRCARGLEIRARPAAVAHVGRLNDGRPLAM